MRFLLPAFSSSATGVVQFGQIRTADAQNEARRLGDLVHGREGILVRAVQDGLIVLDRLDGGLCRLDVLGVDDNGAVGRAAAFLQSSTNFALSPAS